jgi:hypothetical protein
LEFPVKNTNIVVVLSILFLRGPEKSLQAAGKPRPSRRGASLSMLTKKCPDDLMKG